MDKARFEMANQKRVNYCMKHGHDWAIKIDPDNKNPQWLLKICTICGAQQLFYVELRDDSFEKAWEEFLDLEDERQ